MNEVTKIHLGRQAFAISAEAHRELREYLDSIAQHVHDEDVVREIELRMSELLAERDVKNDQVILPADVHYLKEQLGAAKDFAEIDEHETTSSRQPENKRLFRDTDNAMIAGVAAGLANYFGVDALLIRLLFVIATFAGGWGILIYLVLWVLVPEAKTSSDRLQMLGKAVTIDNLKETVKRADLKGAAQRANNSLAAPINSAFNALLKLIGTAFVALGLSMLLGLVSAATYTFLRGNIISRESVFPVGLEEHVLVYTAAGIAAIIFLFIVLFGVAIFRRKWPIHTWVTGTLIGLLLIGTAAGGAMTADIIPQVRDRYNSNVHTTVRVMQPFNAVNLNATAGVMNIQFQTASTYSVSLQYYGHANLSAIQTNVKNNTLTVNSENYDDSRDCQALCVPKDHQMIITINSPNAQQLENATIPSSISVPAMVPAPQ